MSHNSQLTTHKHTRKSAARCAAEELNAKLLTRAPIGVGVLIRDPINPSKVFAGIRKNSHGSDTLALPGGHLELFESWEQCAIRETLEETGLKLRQNSVRFGHVTNDIMEKEGKHYVTIFMMGECQCEETLPKNLEPHKCAGWDSYSWDDFCRCAAGDGDAPKLFGPLLKLIEEAPPNVLQFLNDR